MSRAKSVIRPTILLLAIASWVLVAFSQGVAHATMPPRPGEMARYRADGTYAQRMDFARRMGNNRVHPALVRRTAERLRALRGGGPAPAPNLPYTTSLPTEGSPKIALLCVDFSDYPHVTTAAVIADKMVGDGDASEAPYESLKNFYARSSYGKLNIGGNVLGWFRAKNPRSAYTDFPG